jgi:hypothetical protein
MRAFRLRQRRVDNGKIIKHCDYVGIDRFLKYGEDTYNRYNRPQNKYIASTAELCEMLNGKWKVINIKDVL